MNTLIENYFFDALNMNQIAISSIYLLIHNLNNGVNRDKSSCNILTSLKIMPYHFLGD
jgi:hypothetical protein